MARFPQPLRIKPSRRLNWAMRVGGLMMLALPLWLAQLLLRWRHSVPPHPASWREVALGALALVLFWCANLLIVAGDGLLRAVPRPPRPLF